MRKRKIIHRKNLRLKMSNQIMIMSVLCSTTLAAAAATENPSPCAKAAAHLVTLDPGHFHAALVQNRSYPDLAPTVKVFAPAGSELDAHLALVRGFNARASQPTAWREEVACGADFLDRFRAAARAGALGANPIVVLAGKNDRKGAYARAAVEAGCHVLADKPLAITPEVFAETARAMRLAREKGLVFADIMTERHEITTILQRALVADRALYGEQDSGTPDDPAVTKLSVHHFCKLVDGKPLRRPGWYYDTAQQGEAIVDVTTHLVDLVQWEAFPDAVLSTNDVRMISARQWATPISAADYRLSTGLDSWPAYLKKDVDAANVLQCRANGAFTYALRGVHAKVAVEWHFMPPKGTGDTHSSKMRGTRAEITIRQDATTRFKPALFVRARGDAEATGRALAAALRRIEREYPGVTSVPANERGVWRIDVPTKYDVGHEAHFSSVVAECLRWVRGGGMPEERRANMLVKYHTLVEALKWARERR